MGRLTPLEDFNYSLPKSFIAQEPLKDRDSSRLMVLSDNSIKNAHFKDITDFILPGDCLVINTTKVIPSKVYGKKVTGGKVEILFLKKLSHNGAGQAFCSPATGFLQSRDSGTAGQKWTALSRDKILGKEVFFENGARALVTGNSPAGEFMVELGKGVAAEALFEPLGELPLPPYISRKTASAETKRADKETYQTVYAIKTGSAAAPTAGLHFTKNLLAQITSKGAEVVEIITHIGWDTFRPVRAKFAEEHKMHGECFEVTPAAAKKINACRSAGGRVFAVGTSVVRALESSVEAVCGNGTIFPSSGMTNIFIYPGYNFKAIDAMITNFHLPRSTPLLMVCALAGTERIKNAYEEAKRAGYRFYSYGDAMLILNETFVPDNQRR